MSREQRRLAAILVADVVGSSRLMSQNESATVAHLLDHIDRRLKPIIALNDGRLFKQVGDGALVEFASPVNALRAAIEFQEAMAGANRNQPDDTAIVFRIGLHLGDVIVVGDDLLGDGVNVAAEHVVVSLGGTVEGDIVAKAVGIHGVLNGAIRAGAVTLSATARVQGEILYEVLIMEAGAQLEANCRRISTVLAALEEPETKTDVTNIDEGRLPESRLNEPPKLVA